MPRQSNGVYQAPGGTAAVSLQAISSVAFNTLETDIGTEITNSLDRLGRSAMQAALPMGANQINNLAAGALDTDAANLAQIKAGLPSAQVIVTGAAGTTRQVRLQTSGADRWIVRANAVAESGANVGSDLSILAVADDGVTATAAIKITRSTGVAAFTAQPSGLGLVGMIVDFPANVAPLGWLECDGSLVSRTTYADLWTFANASGNIVADATWTGSVLDGSFSTGDGSTTFRLPDMRGNFRRGWDHGRGVDAGRAIGTKQNDAVGPHTHPVGVSSVTVTANSSVNNYVAPTGSTNTGNPNAGAGVSTENRPRNAAVMTCIRYV